MNNQNDLSGLNALVTGSSRGIGKDTAFALARLGANVVVHSRNTMHEAKKIASEIKSTTNIESFALQADVSDPSAVESMFEKIKSELGGIDILINNAGIVHNSSAEDLEFEQWTQMININLTGVFLCSQAAGRRMIEQKRGGAIINVSSICAHIVVHPQKQCHYNAAKAGVGMLTKSLAVEWAEYGIRVNAISPGYIATDLVAHMKDLHPTWKGRTPLGRLGMPSDIAEVIAFLATPKNAFITGSDWLVDGGYVCW